MNALLLRLHNPHARACACDPDCWCRRTAFGRAFKWWIPRHLGPRHRNRALEAWKRSFGVGALRDWKRQQSER